MYSLYYKFRFYIGLALLLVLGIALMKYSAWLDRTFFGSSNPPNRSSQRPNQPTPLGGSAGSPSTPGGVRVQLNQAKSLLSEASLDVSKALQEMTSWEKHVEPLGRRELAKTGPKASEQADQAQLFDRLAYVLRRKRMSSQELRDASARIDDLRRTVDGLLQQSNPTLLPTSQADEIRALQTACRKARQDWKRDVGQALAIKHFLDAQTGSSPDPKAPTTVSSQLKDADARAAIAALDREIKFEQEQEERERERKTKLAEQERKRKQQEAQLRAKATSAEVKALLAPFFEPRDVQPSLSGASIRFRDTADKKPMSLSALTAVNALTDSVDGLKRLASIGGHRKLSEPKWSVNSQPGNWSEDDKKMLQTAQQMLRDYGSILVDEGLLSK